MKKLILFSLILSLGSAFGQDQLRLEDLLNPMPELDTSIPAPHEVMGIEVGERHWFNYEVLEYLDAVAEVSDRMISLGEYARSHGGRPLVSYIISSPENLSRLDEIREARADIIDASTRVDLDEQPVVLHMGYTVHGNEPSAGNVIPLVAYYLNASQSPELREQLENVVILFNPIFNPDGFDRFANWSNNHRGRVPSKDPNDREHVENFPSGRTNYYWFDLNRDWLPHQHPESQGRVELFHTWKPNVQLDFHEQGSNSSYFFMPGKPERTNPLTPDINQELTYKMAEYHAEVFDEEGIIYFSQEGYDDFFMGKGSTYPDLFGCVGILFEQPSSRGIHQETINGLLTFTFSIANQFRTSLSSLDATADLKDELLDYQRSFYEGVADQNKSVAGHYLATADEDLTRLREFVRLLQGHQIEVELLTEEMEVDGKLFPANSTIAIPAAQTQSTYLTALWNTWTEFEENIFYDVSTWTLPYAFNLKHTREPVRRASSKALPEDFHAPQGRADLPRSEIGYLIDWRDSGSPALLYSLLEAEANVRVAMSPLTVKLVGGDEKAFGYGTLLVSKPLNESIPEKAIDLLKAAMKSGLPVYPVASSFTRTGIDLGSRSFRVLEIPKVLIATGPGIGANDVGEIWHLLDTRVEMPLTMVDSDRLASIDYRDYTHVILTRGLGSLSDSGVKKLKAFVEGGGVIWAQGDNAINWLVGKEMAKVEWRKTEAEKKADAAKKEKKESEDQEPVKRLPFAQATDEAAFKLVRGAIFGGSLDITHPIGYGYTDEFLPIFRRTNKFIEPSNNAYSTPVLYEDEPLLSGYINDENLELVSGSASLVIDQQGSGAVVLALDNPNFRAFWWGTQRLMVNAIFFGDLLYEPN